MDRFEFFDTIPAMLQEQRTKIQWAYDIMKRWHEGQMRDDGDRYIEHLRRSSIFMVQHGYCTADYVICLLLHDVVEDHYIALSMLEQLFGPEIARAIFTISKSYGLEDPLTGHITRTAEKPKDVYFASIRRNGRMAALAKCADRIDNLTDLIGDQPAGSRWTPEKRLKQVAETREWILPLAYMHDQRFADILERQCAQIEANALAALARA